MDTPDRSSVDQDGERTMRLRDAVNERHHLNDDVRLIKNRVSQLKIIESKMLKKIEKTRIEAEKIIVNKQNNLQKYKTREDLQRIKDMEVYTKRERNLRQRQDHGAVISKQEVYAKSSANITVVEARKFAVEIQKKAAEEK